MKLGGKAAELITQVETHKVDIIFTLAGYTPGRFPRLEVFELLDRLLPGKRNEPGALPQVVKRFQDGAIDGALLPYEIVSVLNLGRLAPHITEFAGHRGLYTAVLLMAMSKKTYESLDEEERKVIDAHSGTALSAKFGRIYDGLSRSHEMWSRRRAEKSHSSRATTTRRGPAPARRPSSAGRRTSPTPASTATS